MAVVSGSQLRRPSAAALSTGCVGYLGARYNRAPRVRVTNLRESLAAAREIKRRRALRPLESVQWLPLQDEFLRDPAKLKQMRAGNQAQGKTWAGLAEGIFHSLGEHPYYYVPPPPSEGAIICATAPQSLPIQQKMWELLPKDLLHPSTEFIPGKGFVGRYPTVRYLNGSITYILTAGQGGLGLSARTLDWVHFDEPPKNPRVYAEVLKRLMRGNPGRAWLTYTPVNAPTAYLRKLCKEGVIVDHHSRLTPAALVPVGSSYPMRLRDGSLMDQAYIDRETAKSFDYEVDVVIHGGWEMQTFGAVFKAFRPSGERSHVVEELPVGDLSTRVSIDYGSGSTFSAASSLLQADTRGKSPKLWVCDEAVSGAGKNATTIDEDAQAVVDMLDRNGIHWSELDFAIGDRPWNGHNGLQRKDNKAMMAALERCYDMPPHSLQPRLKTAKTGKDRGGSKSVSFGSRFLHRAMVPVGHFHIHSRCEIGLKAVQQWNGAADSEHKHILDTWRYGFDDLIFANSDDAPMRPVLVR